MNTRNTYITKIDDHWYAFAADQENYQVYSIGSDCPKGGGVWVAHLCDEGIKYVASWSPSRAAAYQKARRNGYYCGEI